MVLTSRVVEWRGDLWSSGPLFSCQLGLRSWVTPRTNFTTGGKVNRTIADIFSQRLRKKKKKNPEIIAPAYGSHQVLLPPWRTEPDGLSRNLLEISQCFSSSCLHKAANSHPAGGMLSSYTPPHLCRSTGLSPGIYSTFLTLLGDTDLGTARMGEESAASYRCCRTVWVKGAKSIF